VAGEAPAAASGLRAEITVPAALLALIVLACFAGPWLASLPSATNGDITAAGLPIGSAHHLLGTDPVGNDILARLLIGGRLSLQVAVGSTALGLVVGGLTGMLAGYRGGALDTSVATGLDILIAFPPLVLALVLAAGLGPGRWHLILALALFGAPAYARLARAAAAKVRHQRFISAAELAGTGPLRIVLTHVAPHVVPQLLTFCCLGLSVTIILEASLGYLGLGVSPPAPSLGNMIAHGQEYLTIRPSLVLLPAALLCLITVALTVLSDGARRYLAQR
jgi:peptide/nickel transport system permease protein